jgi:hypothetical protein
MFRFDPSAPPTEQEAVAASGPSSVMGIPWMQPDKVAPAVVFLCTDAANRVSGACLDATPWPEKARNGLADPLCFDEPCSTIAIVCLSAESC